MLELFKQHLILKYPFLKDKKILIAVSGGLDSMTLAYLMHQLHYKIAIAHCNFKLRGEESDKDEEFVLSFGKKNKIPDYVQHFDTEKYADKHKISIQMAARKLRYDWFYKLINQENFDYLLTAHHLDDMLETFLINLSRGTGLDGLVGIPQINEKIVRPLLIFNREEISSFAQKEGIEWREDQSNLTVKYHRNKLRHEVIPILKELNPSLLSSFQNTLNHLKNSQEILLCHINDIKDQVIVIEATPDHQILLKIAVEKLNRLPHPKNYLFEILKNYGFTEWDDVSNLVNAQTGKYVLSKTHRLIKDRGFLLLTLKPTSNITAIENNQFEILNTTKSISSPINLKFQSVNPANINLKSTSENSILLDKDLLKFPLILRKWKKGEYFYPFGMVGSKKLSKFFKDEKYSLPQKENTWVLYSENQVVWVVGKRSDNRFRVSSQTNNILKITLNNEKNS